VFVVLLVVFAIAFAMSSVSFVAQTNNWKSLADQYRDQFQVADTTLRNAIAAQAAEKGHWLDTSEAQYATIKDLELKAAGARNELDAAKRELATLQSEKSGVDAAVSKLTNELAVAQAAWKESTSQRDELEKQNIDLQKRNQDLSIRVDEMTQRIVVLTQQNRQSEQQIHILRTENQRLSQGSRSAPLPGTETTSGTMDTITPMTAVASSAIRGRVTQVNGNLVSISIGSADGVQKDMEFVVYRGGEYVGDLKVTDVEPTQAAGRMKEPPVKPPKVNDTVADAARFGVNK
jgi:uncharacterized protein (DUF3084 family)